jgi:hypothetical protein
MKSGVLSRRRRLSILLPSGGLSPLSTVEDAIVDFDKGMDLRKDGSARRARKSFETALEECELNLRSRRGIASEGVAVVVPVL